MKLLRITTSQMGEQNLAARLMHAHAYVNQYALLTMMTMSILSVGCDNRPNTRQIAESSTPLSSDRQINSDSLKTQGKSKIESSKNTVPNAKASADMSLHADSLGQSTTAEVNQQSILSPSQNHETTPNQMATQPGLKANNIESLQQLVIEHLETGDLDSAWNSIRIASRIDSDNFDTRYLKARVLAERNRFVEAVKTLDDLAIQDPSIQLPVLGQTAEWLTFDGRWQAAETRYRRLIQELPEIGLAHRRLAQLLLRKGERLEACQLFSMLCEAGNVEELELRHLLRVSRPFSGMESTDESAPVGHLGKARYHYGENDPALALAELTGVTPKESEAFALKGRLLALSNQIKDLEQWNAQSSDEGERYSDHWFAKGIYSHHQKDYQNAIQSFCRSIVIDPTDSDAYQRLSVSLKSDRQTETAKLVAKRSLMIQETHDIAQAFSERETREPQTVATLCQILKELGRPVEALSWQAVAMVYNQREMRISDEQLATQLQNVNQQRMSLLQNGNANATQEFILCGLNLN
jgi:tetratricopeptide (TPR) repeat protein